MPTITIDGSALHYLDEGSGPPLLLLHGFPLQAEMWRAQIDALAGHHRVIAVDLPGFGRSDPPLDPAACSIEGYAAAVIALLDRLGAAPTSVAGLSMGGYVALALCRLHPDAVDALVLADTRAEADTDQARSQRDEQIAALRRAGDPLDVLEPMLERLVGAQGDARAAVLERARGLAANPAGGLICALEAMRDRRDASVDLVHIAVPTLVVVGEHDTLTPPEGARAMATRIAGARLDVIPAAGHLANLDNPDGFTAALAEFLAAIRA